MGLEKLNLVLNREDILTLHGFTNFSFGKGQRNAFVGATKQLHLLFPEFFPLKDNAQDKAQKIVARKLGLPYDRDAAENYFGWMEIAQKILLNYWPDFDALAKTDGRSPVFLFDKSIWFSGPVKDKPRLMADTLIELYQKKISPTALRNNIITQTQKPRKPRQVLNYREAISHFQGVNLKKALNMCDNGRCLTLCKPRKLCDGCAMKLFHHNWGDMGRMLVHEEYIGWQSRMCSWPLDMGGQLVRLGL